MNFPGNFVRIGRTDIRDLKYVVGQLTPMHWSKNARRQRRYEAHRDTQTIGLVYDEDFRHVNPTKLPLLEVFEPALRPTLALIADHYERSEIGRQLCARNGHGYFVRASLIRLNPGGTVAPHRDNNFSLAHSHRVHVPIITSEHVTFTVGGETLHMEEGNVYEINNRRLHSVANDSTDGRVHLVLDFVIPGEQCCCSAKTHPGIPCSLQACLLTDRLKIPCTCFPEH